MTNRPATAPTVMREMGPQNNLNPSEMRVWAVGSKTENSEKRTFERERSESLRLFRLARRASC